MLRVLRGIAVAVFVLVVVGVIGIGGFIGVTLAHFGRNLPDYQQLTDYVPAIGSKIYASDGSLMTEFESEHRIPVTFAKIPKLVIRAFLAAEDRDFYSHGGVNPAAIFRAAMSDVMRVQRGQRPIGASTITQQVVRHFLLSNEVSMSRKIKEMLLSYRLERTLSKDRILEIYLNEIYLGAGAYGVAAAADTYFQKPLDQLTLSEAAFLAALPKAPNNYNPVRHAAAARARRDWVLSGMAEVGWITAADAKAAEAQPLGTHIRSAPDGGQQANGYFAEEVRRELIARFGEKTLYEGGLRVRTSFTPSDQQMAETAFRQGLVEYDRRHGWRGPLAHMDTAAAAQGAVLTMADPPGIGAQGTTGWQLAAVTGVDAGGATIALKTGGTGRIPLEELRWARRTLQDQRVGAAVRQARDVLNPGDIVLVEPVGGIAPVNAGPNARRAAPTLPLYGLRQIPDVSGGVVAMEPNTGRVLALVGGWSYQQSQFDRATQAKRQPGSAFKPFVYVTALENGFTPQSVVENSPISIPQGPGLPPWTPVNYEGTYGGMTTLDDGLVHSLNLVTARLATMIGLPAIAKTVEDFDVMDHMPLYYSMSLGAGETTLMRMTGAYGMLDNGGHWILPSLIDLVQDRDGRILYQKGVNGCSACFVAAAPQSPPAANALYKPAGAADSSSIYMPNARYIDGAVVYKPTKRDPLVDPTADYQVVSMMQGVVQRGTGTEVAKIGKPIAGKTGTTSDWFDAWFVGFSPDLVAGVFVGFDDPRTLGDGEVGGHVAAPIFRDFMIAALKDQPAKPFPVPAGANIAVASTGNAANVGSSNKDSADLDDDNPALPDSGQGAKSAQTASLTPDDTMPPSPDAAPAWPTYPSTDAGGYSGAKTANAPGSWGWTAPTYPSAGSGYAPQSPGYPVPPPSAAPYPAAAPYAAASPYAAPYPPPQYPAPAPQYPPRYPAAPAAGWSSRPSGGTGGLY